MEWNGSLLACPDESLSFDLGQQCDVIQRESKRPQACFTYFRSFGLLSTAFVYFPNGT